MVINIGEKIHLTIRRNFEGDLRRHFVGEVKGVHETVVRAEGYIFVLNTGSNQYDRRPEKRTRFVGLADAGNIINILPPNADLEAVKYIQSPAKRLVVTDGKSFTLDVNEFGATQ